MTTYEVLSIFLGCATLSLTALAVISHKKVSALKRQLEAAHAFVATTTTRIPRHHDIVVLGPRACGKTSIAELWTKPWADIRRMRPSDKWKTFEWDVVEIERKTQLDEQFGVRRPFVTVLRARVHDYPGDDDYRIEAISALKDLENAVLILVFAVDVNASGVIHSSQNNSYYSRVFLEAVEQHRAVNRILERVVVVFNKADLLPPEWSRSESLSNLKAANQDAISRIESLFSGKLSYMLISALDNRGMIDLLGLASSAGLPKEVQAKLTQELQRLRG
jgi:GTPase SAR1 family protein